MINGVLTSSKTDDWGTPQHFFDELNEEFHFTLDPCASDRNHKCKKYYTINDNGLFQNWEDERVFMNPPYDRDIVKWIAKAVVESKRARVIVCLVPARTDTKWWHDYAMKADEIRFIKGRLKFNDGKNNAPFPSVILVFGGD